MKNIAIFASGSGTNAENIVRFFHEGNRLRVAVVLVDRENAGVIERMERLNVPTLYFPRSVWRNDPQQIIRILQENDIELIALAGFLSIVADEIVDTYPQRILNIHPSLLPKFGGSGMWGGNVHEAVIAAGETKSGATVHYVTKVVDGGEILLQEEVDVLPDDTPETLEQRVHEAEYILFPRAIDEALRRLDKENTNPDRAWAEVLKVPYDPEATRPETPEAAETNRKTPPHIPNVPPQVPPQTQMQQPATPSFQQTVNPVQPTPNPAVNNFMTGQSEVEPMPKTYLIWSILSIIICSMIPGIIAIVFSSRVSSLYYAGDIEGAKRASRNAEIWIIVSFCLGVLSSTLYVPLSLLG